jgi:hypothetical protein
MLDPVSFIEYSPSSGAMMTYMEIVQNVTLTVPELQSIDSKWVASLEKKLSVPMELFTCWAEIGCGFFSRNAAGERLTDFQNRFLGPDEIEDLLDVGVFDGPDPFSEGIPFFETADMGYFVLRADGAVYSVYKKRISSSLASFLDGLMADPEFWLPPT